ncbi:uncharacterized protein LOC125081802 [Lutra lutra]|uniref:uncharacterized protein LOC125081802 n=1 Tax=Lutra lutra TaxID=9657 RepID=UPI001FD17EC4|nr:uncharacterized protein LOC125081802 [Lutra lutra]
MVVVMMVMVVLMIAMMVLMMVVMSPEDGNQDGGRLVSPRRSRQLGDPLLSAPSEKSHRSLPAPWSPAALRAHRPVTERLYLWRAARVESATQRIPASEKEGSHVISPRTQPHRSGQEMCRGDDGSGNSCSVGRRGLQTSRNSKQALERELSAPSQIWDTPPVTQQLLQEFENPQTLETAAVVFLMPINTVEGLQQQNLWEVFLFHKVYFKRQRCSFVECFCLLLQENSETDSIQAGRSQQHVPPAGLQADDPAGEAARLVLLWVYS